MPKLKLLKHGFYSLVSYTLLKCLSRKNWSDLLEQHEINFFRSTPSTIVLGYTIEAGLASFIDV